MKAYGTFLLLFAISTQICCEQWTEEEINNFFRTEYEVEETRMCHDINEAEFDYDTDINNSLKEEILLNALLKAGELDKRFWTKYLKDLNISGFKDEKLKREIKIASMLGNNALEPEKLEQLADATNKMQKIYSTAKICPYEKQTCDLKTEGLNLEPGIQDILIKTRDYEKLSYAWSAWRGASGANMIDQFKTYVTLSNEAARTNQFKDKGEMWRSSYESETFIQDIDDLWSQVEPLYVELHKYVARRLKKVYGDKLDLSDGLIPAHLFGNMWAQTWGNIADLMVPFPDASKLDVDAALEEKGYTVLKMFETADEFYRSMGLLDESVSFNTSLGAMIEKPDDGREVLCHASAWDFCNASDFRIKMCTEVTFDYFTTIHHELGHIQYFMQYKEQPISFRDGANPGFHEAIGDTIALSVSTPKHLKEIGLLDDYQENYNSTINTLMNMALDKVAFLPFGLLIDKWRWDVFSGDVQPDKWNTRWWEYRKRYQKIKPPVPRSDEKDFDPGAKYHITADYPYIAYYVSFIIQFQFYKGLCVAAGEYDPNNPGKKPLHECDFYKSKEAGQLLSSALQLGASQPWPDVMQILTDQRKMDASALLEYFKPLYDFLKVQNMQDNLEDIKSFLDNEYEKAATEMCTKVVEAEFNYNVDIDNKEKENILLNVTLESAAFDKYYWETYFSKLNPSDYADEGLKREISKLKILGTAALEEKKLENFTIILNTMGNIYSTAKICPYKNQNCNKATEGLSLQPGIESVLIESEDYDELAYVWETWRDASGAKMKKMFETYVDLSNEVAQANESIIWKTNFCHRPKMNDNKNNHR